MRYKKTELDKKGKKNRKVEIAGIVEQAAVHQAEEEEKKASQPDRFEQKRQKQLNTGREKNVHEIVVEQVDTVALNAPYPEVEYKIDGQAIQASEEEKHNLNLVIIGHVDSGKSTLSGQILLKNGVVTQRELRANERKAEINNKNGFALAYMMDETEEEQERGVTIEVTTRHFVTANRNFTILDAPGHRDFIANMITGAAQANCSLLLIDSGYSQFERGWEQGNQSGTTREHAVLARSLGVTQIVVVCNKMENVEFKEDRYTEIKEQVKPFLVNIGFKAADVYFVPISAINDENVTRRAANPLLTSWLDQESPCLLEILDGLKLPNRTFTRPLRVTVSDYMQKTSGPLIGDCVAAKVETGVIIEKKELLLMPQNVLVGIKGLTR